MSWRHRHAALPAVVVAAAAASLCCGCSEGGTGTAAGSYQLIFDQVEVPGTGSSSVSEGLAVRLDLRDTSGVYEALVSAKGTPVGVFEGSLSSTPIVLDGEFAFQYAGTTDTWRGMRLWLDADGTLGGTFEASGDYYFDPGDYSDSIGDLAATGTIGPDETAPDLWLSAPWLPWGALSCHLSEGVNQGELAGHLQVVGDVDGATVEVEWVVSPEADSKTGWAGGVGALGLFRSWQDLADGGPMALWVLDGLADPSGNAVHGEALEFEVVGLGTAATAHTFDELALDIGSWGAVEHLVQPGNKHPSCQQGGCLALGPLLTGPCGGGADPTGIVVRLAHTGGDLARVTYRATVQDDLDGQLVMESSDELHPMNLHAVAFDRSENTAIADVQTGSFTPVADGWRTEWLTLAVPLPGSPTEDVALQLGVGGGESCSEPDSSLHRIVWMTVIIDRIEVL